MTKYPVFRSLYKPLFMGGVPLLFLFAEIITVVILIALKLYILILLVIPVHVIKTSKQRRKTDEVMEEASDQTEDS